MILQEEREWVTEYGKKCVEHGLIIGAFGNISVFNREQRLFAISPSGIDYFKLKPEDIVVMTPDGEKVDGDHKPSSETDLHRIFYQRRVDINACIHTHSVYATTLSCLQWSIEPIHYIIAYAGKKAPCIPYKPFGSYELADAAYAAMGENHSACLLGNHGLVCVGPDIAYTFDMAEQMEFLAHIYYHCRIAGGGVQLSAHDLDQAMDSFKAYRHSTRK
jgi:L-fuculose-phosphate aldolase